MIEDRFGRRWATLLLGVIYFAIVGTVIKYAFDWFIIPFFRFVSDVTKTQTFITQENFLPLVITFVFVVIFIILYVIIYSITRRFKRRILPQEEIDNLAELRSEGVSIYAEHINQEGLPDWIIKWDTWRKKVENTLHDKFTRAEELSFSRLGVIEPTMFAHAISNEHGHKLMMLKKQLSILENLITRHQDRH